MQTDGVSWRSQSHTRHYLCVFHVQLQPRENPRTYYIPSVKGILEVRSSLILDIAPVNGRSFPRVLRRCSDLSFESQIFIKWASDPCSAISIRGEYFNFDASMTRKPISENISHVSVITTIQKEGGFITSTKHKSKILN